MALTPRPRKRLFLNQGERLDPFTSACKNWHAYCMKLNSIPAFQHATMKETSNWFRSPTNFAPSSKQA